MSSHVLTPVIVIHGGAWAIPDSLKQASIDGVLEAARRGYARLIQPSTEPIDGAQRRSTAVEAVQLAVESMEDNPAFDAGFGSVLNLRGDVEMDAIVMDGTSLDAGAVASVQNVGHPIRVARRVMDTIPHVLLVGEGATQFARESGFPFVETRDLVTDEARAELENFKKFNTTIKELFSGHDTVGAVAIDADGCIAAATSTGGITAKRPGRVGDSPLIGCGAYADNQSAGVSCTGNGEAISKMTLARLVSFKVSSGSDLQSSLDAALDEMRRRVNGFGGVIGVDHRGDGAVAFTTERMPWVIAKYPMDVKWGIEPGQVESLKTSEWE